MRLTISFWDGLKSSLISQADESYLTLLPLGDLKCSGTMTITHLGMAFVLDSLSCIHTVGEADFRVFTR